jgi:tetratricopeptide (TPR) repeat protein
MHTRTRVLGPVHPATLASVTNLAGVRRDQGDLAAARDLYREATKGLLATLGASHTSTSAAMSGYAQTLLDLGEFAKSCEIYERLLAFLRQYLGEAHRETLDAVNELALARYLSNDEEAAEELYRSAMEIARRA